MAGATKISRTLSLAILLITLVNACWEEQGSCVAYANGARSLRDLPVCNNPTTACNIIHKRFWLTPLVKKLCKCPDRRTCTQEWSADLDKTIMLNGRAQLKFCGQVSKLPTCSETETAMVVQSYNGSNGLMQNIELNCYCPDWHYFERLRIHMSRNNDGKMVKQEYYGCHPIQACAAGEFCGHITVNFYETYHRCSCPKEHICIMNDRQRRHASELLYEGLAYKGMCTYYGS